MVVKGSDGSEERCKGRLGEMLQRYGLVADLRRDLYGRDLYVMETDEST